MIKEEVFSCERNQYDTKRISKEIAYYIDSHDLFPLPAKYPNNNRGDIELIDAHQPPDRDNASDLYKTLSSGSILHHGGRDNDFELP